MDKKPTIFFFFPYYHTGGAEKVHLEIVKCFSGFSPRVYFTDRSRDNKNKKEFYNNSRAFNFFGINNKIKLVENVLAFFLAKKINKTDGALVFGSNSRFFYSLIKKLNKEIKVIDLVHWLDGEMGKIIIKNSGEVNRRVVVTKAILPVLESAYPKAGVSRQEMKKIRVIENFVPVTQVINKDYEDKLQVIYIGRDTYEKRAALAFQIANNLNHNKNIVFTFVGRGLKRLGKEQNNGSDTIDLIKDGNKMEELYKKAHVIILTSLFEGFPFVVMEAMSFGVVPVVTAVGGLPEHLQDKYNSLLTNNSNVDGIVSDIVDSIVKLEKDRGLLKTLSENANCYSKEHFSKNDFCIKYKKIMEE
jgi:glycosyltransferase involved in cell wall biosynthesis